MISETPEPPPVPNGEDVYRGLLGKWWHPEERKVSSACFSYQKFSVDRVIMTTLQLSLDRYRKSLTGPCGVVQFNCGLARKFEFDTREEIDPKFPDNTAHATVTSLVKNNKRKRMAKKLAEACSPPIVEPNVGVV